MLREMHRKCIDETGCERNRAELEAALSMRADSRFGASLAAPGTNGATAPGTSARLGPTGGEPGRQLRGELAFRGRSAEREVLQAGLRAATEGQGGVVLMAAVTTASIEPPAGCAQPPETDFMYGPPG